jgi:trigger factor
LKIESQLQETHELKLTVEVEPEVLESAKRKAAKVLSKKVKIPGFRPGKAPYNRVLTAVGEPAILDDAFNIIVEDIYPKILEQEDISPYGPGSLENIVSMDPPILEFKVPLAPEVTLGDYRSIRVKRKEKKATKKDIQKVIDNLLEQQAALEESDQPVKEGDMVYVVLSADRKEPDEEKGVLVEERRFPLIIEKEDTDGKDEWPFSGFSRHLIDAKIGDEKTLEYSFPDDYQFEDLQGVDAVYQVKVDEVKARVLPELNDEFVKSIGEYETVKDLKSAVKENVQARYDEESKIEFDEKIIKAISKDAEIKFPPQMMEHEVTHYINDLNMRLENQGMNMDLYLKSRSQDIDALKEEVTPNAEESLKRGLILMEVGKQEKIEVTPEEVEALVEEQAKQIQGMFPEKEAKKILQGESLQNLVARIVNNEITSKTLDRLYKIALGESLEEEKEEDAEDSGDEKETTNAGKKEVKEEQIEKVSKDETEDDKEEKELTTEVESEDIKEEIVVEEIEADSNEILMENAEESDDNKEDE